MLKRILSGALGAYHIGTGVYLLIAGRRFYESLPGVADTGPFNPHFAADVGAAFLVAGLAMIVRAGWPRYWPAAVAGAGFAAAHGLIHVVDLLSGHSAHALFEWTTVVLPAALGLWAAFPGKGEIRS